MRCDQCKKDRPENDFLPMRRKGWKVTKCNECARANMAKWERSRMVGKKADEFKPLEE